MHFILLPLRQSQTPRSLSLPLRSQTMVHRVEENNLIWSTPPSYLVRQSCKLIKFIRPREVVLGFEQTISTSTSALWYCYDLSNYVLPQAYWVFWQRAVLRYVFLYFSIYVYAKYASISEIFSAYTNISETIYVQHRTFCYHIFLKCWHECNWVYIWESYFAWKNVSRK